MALHLKRCFEIVAVLVCCWLVSNANCSDDKNVKYQPTWESLDARPLPPWYDEAKIGIFIHWGVFSVPSFGSEWFWYSWQTSSPNSPYRQFMAKSYKPGFTYADFAPMFTAEFYDPDHWAELFAAAGAKYVVFVSKHHEGFCNWDSNVSFSWNSMDVGPRRDLVGELAASIRNKTDIRFGIYHSLLEWFNQLYEMDKANNFQTQYFSQGKTIPELHELVNKYKPEIVWSDGDWEASDTYWTSKEFLAWLYNESPVKDTVLTNDRWGSGDTCTHGGYYTCTDSPVKDTVLVNDRWGNDCRCKHGGFYNCDDKYNPGVVQKHKWENCMTLDSGSWGYRRNADIGSYLTMAQLIQTMAETVSCGGNLLINVGPTHDGRIVPIFEERLRQLGAWLNVNGEAVYASKPWIHQNDTLTPNIWYTQKKSTTSESGYSVYAWVLKWPESNILELGAPAVTINTRIQVLGYPGHNLKYLSTGTAIAIALPNFNPSNIPCTDGWILKFDNLKNSWAGY